MPLKIRQRDEGSMTKAEEPGVDMIRNLPIYKYIKDYTHCIPVLTFQKGEYLFRGEDIEKPVFYIINGNIEVENIPYRAKHANP